jgi:ABC-type antimicrobial peptide transport system permease subunit
VLTQVAFVTEEYFETLGIPVLRGRFFREDEVRPDGGLVVLGETAARRLFGEGNAVGATISAHTFRGARDFRVIGVVADTRDLELRGPFEPTMYLPFPDHASSQGTLLVEGPGSPELLSRTVREAVARVDPNVPVFRSEALGDLVDRRLSDERTLLRLLGLLGGLAAALAGVGLYAVVAHTVAERTREIGIRIAVGADPLRVLGLIARHAAALGGTGVVVGMLASAALAHVLRSRLFGVEPFDPVVFGTAALLLGFVVLAASVLPARAATRVDPVTSLRAE